MKNPVSKWRTLADPSYELVDLGRPAVFFIPLKKLRRKIGGVRVEDSLHHFLIEKFGAYNSLTALNFGFWKDPNKRMVTDRCRQYEVSFLGKERLPALIRKLAAIAYAIGEDCLYLKAGQYTCLVFPRKRYFETKEFAFAPASRSNGNRPKLEKLA
jgi:hypothetical protein